MYIFNLNRKARKKRDKKKIEIKDEVPKSVVRRRKKEIYERDELYKGRPSKPKDKKSGRKVKEAAKGQKQTEITVPKASKRRIRVPGVVTVVDLGKAMGIKAKDLIKALIGSVPGRAIQGEVIADFRGRGSSGTDIPDLHQSIDLCAGRHLGGVDLGVFGDQIGCAGIAGGVNSYF